MAFPKAVKEKAAVACNRCCCICHEFKGIKLEFHHIKQEANGGENTFENCIPLCFDCHADMGGVNPSHPKGNSYSERELKMHRDNWYKRCAQNPITLSDASLDDIQTIKSFYADIAKLIRIIESNNNELTIPKKLVAEIVPDTVQILPSHNLTASSSQLEESRTKVKVTKRHTRINKKSPNLAMNSYRKEMI